jgi:Ca-activated chloride channel family protein
MAPNWARSGGGSRIGPAWRLFAASLLCAIVVAFLPRFSHAADGPPLTIIMDGSGSMWGKIGTERLAKFQLVRQGLVEALPKLPSDFRVGLVAYGHRRTGCQDVEVLRGPEAGEVMRITDMLADFNPRGRGPVTAGLQAALETMPKGAPGTVLLVHDDLDNCQQNPCTLTDTLRTQYPRVVVHVLSIAMTFADARQMQCLTATTGGQHYVAASGAQVVSAIAEVIEIASRAPRPATPAMRAMAEKRDMPEPGGPGLHLVASLGKATVVPDLPVRWRVEALGNDKAPVQRLEGGAVTLPLVPGRYAVTAELGLLATRQEIEVGDVASMRVQLALAGGTLQLSALAGRFNKPLEGTRFVIRPAGSETKQAAASWIARGAAAEVALPEGRYEVVVTHGTTRTVQEATVAVGERRAVEARLSVGELELAAFQSEGGNRIEQVTYVIQEDDPDAPQGRREVARSAAARPVFVLPAGTYHVLASTGAAEFRDRVAVGAGEIVRRDVVMNAAEVVLTSGLVARIASEPEEVQWRIMSLDRRDAKVVRAYGTSSRVVLSAGKYRIEGRFGPLNALASRDIALSPGAKETVSLMPPAARVRLRLAPQKGEVVSDVFWKVRLVDGPIVWSSSESEPLGLLQQGNYVIEVQTRQGRYEGTAEIRAGADRVVVLGEP